MHLGWSSHVYPLDAADLAGVPDYDGPDIPACDLPGDEVVLLIRREAPDALLRGRAAIEAAGAGTVDVRIVFVPTIAKWNLPFTLMRLLRNRRRFKSSGVYHIATDSLRSLGLERAVRTLDHPQRRGSSDRIERMHRLEESLRTEGYDDSKPVVVMLCRTRGVEDSVRQGHHRISVCLEVGIPKVALRFSAAGALPRILGRAVGRPPIRLDVLKRSIESACGKPVRRIVPLGDSPNPAKVIVVPEPGGRFVLDLSQSRRLTVGLAPAILVPLLVAGAFVLDVAVMKTAMGEHSLVAWSQFALSGASSVLLWILVFRERRARCGYAALAFTFAMTAVYELLRDVLDVDSNVVGPAATLSAVSFAVLVAVFARRSFAVGVRRIASSRAFPALFFGAVLTWIVAKLVSSRAIWGALKLTEHDLKTVKHVIEEGTEFLGYAIAACWAISFFLERLADWRHRR